MWCRRAHSKTSNVVGIELDSDGVSFWKSFFFENKKFHNKFGGLKLKVCIIMFLFLDPMDGRGKKKSFVYLNIPKTTFACEWVSRAQWEESWGNVCSISTWCHIFFMCQLLLRGTSYLSHSPATFYVSFDNLLITY